MLSPPKGYWVATVEDTHTRLCICALRKIMLIFCQHLSWGSAGEGPGKSVSFNCVTWFNQAIGSGRYLSLGRQLVQKRGKLVTSTQIRKEVIMLFERAQQSLNDEKTNDGSCSWLMRNLIWPISELWNSAF